MVATVQRGDQIGKIRTAQLWDTVCTLPTLGLFKPCCTGATMTFLDAESSGLQAEQAARNARCGERATIKMSLIPRIKVPRRNTLPHSFTDHATARAEVYHEVF